MPDIRKYSDRAEYLKKAVAKRRQKIKEKAIGYKGDKCALCGYNKYQGALEFHHLDKNGKDFGLLASGLTRSWERTRRELDKCIMVYSNCHKEIHADISQPPRETGDGKTR